MLSAESSTSIEGNTHTATAPITHSTHTHSRETLNTHTHEATHATIAVTHHTTAAITIHTLIHRPIINLSLSFGVGIFLKLENRHTQKTKPSSLSLSNRALSLSRHLSLSAALTKKNKKIHTLICTLLHLFSMAAERVERDEWLHVLQLPMCGGSWCCTWIQLSRCSRCG
ncbi:unnamed protein product [Camellia sinensis]